MTPRQNLLAVLSGGAPEWIPVCMHISNANNLPGHLPRALLAEPLDWLQISEFVGGDVLYEVNAIRGRTSEEVEFASQTRGAIQFTTLTTRTGSLTQEVMHAAVPTPVHEPLPAGHALPGPIRNSVHKAFFIKGLSDYQVIQRYHDALTYESDDELLLRERKRVGEKGLCVLGGGPSSPLYALVANHAGIERFSYDLFDDAEVVESTMRTMTEAACRWYRAAAASPCEVVRCTEDLDTKLVSPDWFRRYAVPALTEYARICHAGGKRFIIHMCGPIKGFLADIVATGADAIHCLTPPPMGDTTVQEARQAMAGRMAAMLRMDATLMLRGSDADIDRTVTDMGDALGDWRNALVIIPCGRAPLKPLRRVVRNVAEIFTRRE